MDAIYATIFNEKKSTSTTYCDFLGLNTFTFSNSSQIDLVLESILRSEKIYKYTYKNGTRIAKGTYSVDKDGKQKFTPEMDIEFLNTEPWPLKISKEYAKILMEVKSTGDRKIQNLRAILLNWILKHRVEQKEFLKFYNLLKETLSQKDFPADIKSEIMSDKFIEKTRLDFLTDKIYNLTVANERPIRIDCEQKLISDAYLASYSRFCTEYVKGSNLENLVEGNSFSDLEKSIEKINELFREFLKNKIKFLPNQPSRTEYMTNVEKINKKYKELIALTKKNTDEFFEVLYKRYETKIKERGKTEEDHKKMKNMFKENFDVMGYLLWEYLTKAWMKNELIHYFDNHTYVIFSLSENFLPSEVLMEKANNIKKFINDKIMLDNDKPHGIHLMSPIDETTDPVVYSGLEYDDK